MKYALCLLTLIVATGAVFAQNADRQPARFINNLTYGEAFGVTAFHLVAGNPTQRETGRRMTDAIIITGLLTEGLKDVTHQARPAPYQNDHKGFPSGHSSLAFTVAAALSAREPRAAWIAYPIAAADAWAREDLGRHTWVQVLAGAALGTWVGRQAGQGTLRLLGHKDQDVKPARLTEVELDSPPHKIGPANQMVVWAKSF